MRWYAIRNRRTQRFIGGTYFSRPSGKRVQLLADEYLPPKLFTEHEIKFEFKRRELNPKTYEIVLVCIICRSIPADLEAKIFIPDERT